MQRYGLRLCAGALQGFRPHLHLNPCAICDSAEAALLSRSSHMPVAAASPSPSPSLAAASPRNPSSVAKAPVQRSLGSAETSSSPTVSLSNIEDRREGLLQWLQLFAVDEAGSRSSVLTSSEDFAATYDAYLRCDDAAIEQDLYTTLLDTLDAQCEKHLVSAERDDKREPSTLTRAAGVRIPDRLVVQRPTTVEAPATSAVSSFAASAHSTTANAFEQHVRRIFPSNPAAVEKQLAFQDALLSVKKVLDEERIPFFLACGTALGARRDGCFIPYDEDIDLGVLFSNLSASDSDAVTEGVSPVTDSSPSSTLYRAQDRIFRLANALASSGLFLIFDVCGAVEKGFELRVLHTPTNVRIDLNVYYPPIPGSDDAVVAAEGRFLWASSFYEAADRRTHQMYRYRHQPFEAELTRVPFCVRTSDADGFLTPPERYVEENYGRDWRTPKQYSYSEGLEKEFNNIIEE